MLLGKRPRGATIVRNSEARALGLSIPRRHAFAFALAAGLTLSLLWILSPGEPSTITASPDAAAVDVDAAVVTALPEPELVVAVNAPPPPQELPWHEETVRKGDNLSLIFKRAGFNDRDVYSVVSQAEDGKLLERIYPGQTIGFQADGNGSLTAVRYTRSMLESVTYRRGESGFESEISTRDPEVRENWATGVITSSLFLAGQEAGLSQNHDHGDWRIYSAASSTSCWTRARATPSSWSTRSCFLTGDKVARTARSSPRPLPTSGETFNAFRYVGQPAAT